VTRSMMERLHLKTSHLPHPALGTPPTLTPALMSISQSRRNPQVTAAAHVPQTLQIKTVPL